MSYFGEITRRSGLLHRSRSPKATEFDTNRKLICDFLLVINTNLAFILQRFRDITFDRSKIAIFGYPSCVLTSPTEGLSFMAILAGNHPSESVKVRHSPIASENLTNNQP